eukprot:6114830-Pleurochrysis_carterae.AAC.1
MPFRCERACRPPKHERQARFGNNRALTSSRAWAFKCTRWLHASTAENPPALAPSFLLGASVLALAECVHSIASRRQT